MRNNKLHTIFSTEAAHSGDALKEIGNVGLCFYSLMFAVLLTGMFINVLCIQIDNVTTNETIRRKWNGDKKFYKSDKNKEPSKCSRIKYILWYRDKPESRI
jgi:hypothetical protein